MGLIKAAATLQQALDQVRHYKAILGATKYPETDAGRALKRSHTANLYRAFMVYETLKIKHNGANENEKDKAG